MRGILYTYFPFHKQIKKHAFTDWDFMKIIFTATRALLSETAVCLNCQWKNVKLTMTGSLLPLPSFMIKKTVFLTSAFAPSVHAATLLYHLDLYSTWRSMVHQHVLLGTWLFLLGYQNKQKQTPSYRVDKRTEMWKTFYTLCSIIKI